MKHVTVTARDTTRRVIESIGTLLEENLDVLDEKGRVLEEEGRMLRGDGTVLERRGTGLRDDGPLLESSCRKIEIPVPMSEDKGPLLRCNGRLPSGNAGYGLSTPGFSTFPPICDPKRPFVHSVRASVLAPGSLTSLTCASTLGRRVFPAPGRTGCSQP